MIIEMIRIKIIMMTRRIDTHTDIGDDNGENDDDVDIDSNDGGDDDDW